MEYKLKKTSKKLLYLLSCALNSVKPHISYISEADSETLYCLAKKHGVSSMASLAITFQDNHKKIFPKKDIEKWKSARDSAFKKRALLDTERDLILLDLDNMGIWYCPLKGIIIQNLYPEYEMREMADNDILFDADKRGELRNYMESLGYSYEFEGVTNHDEYIKAPVYNFEFHRKLFMQTFSTVFTDYYEDVKDRLIKDETNKNGYHFSDSDFYIYFTAHAYKHYREGGTGFKTLTDFYILNREYKDTLDFDYIKKELDELGIKDFEEVLRELSVKLFSDPEKTAEAISSLSDREKKILSFISKSGAYGVEEQRIKSKVTGVVGKKRSRLTRADKLMYFISRFLPDANYYKEAYPRIYKFKILIPGFLLFRTIYRPIVNHEKLLFEFKTVLNM